jgi:hypothetical protein
VRGTGGEEKNSVLLSKTESGGNSLETRVPACDVCSFVFFSLSLFLFLSAAESSFEP